MNVHKNNSRILLVNFNRNSGIKQFSDKICSILRAEGVDFDYVETLSYKVLYSAIKKADKVVFLSNYRKLYPYVILFPFKEYRLVHHDHILRGGAGVREIIPYRLFQLFKARFSRIVVHDMIDNMPSNMDFIKMPLHGEPEKLTRGTRFLQFGRIEDYKNIEQVVDVVSQIPDAQLIIAGTGVVSEALQTKIANASNVSLINQYLDDQVRDLLIENCDYLVLAYSSATQTGLVDLACYFDTPQIISDIDSFNVYKEYGTAMFVNVSNTFTLSADFEKIPTPDSEQYFCMKSACAAINRKQQDDWLLYLSKLVDLNIEKTL